MNLAQRLLDAERGLVLLGQFAMSHPDAACMRALAAYIAEATACAFNTLRHGANPVGAWLAGAVPQALQAADDTSRGKNVVQMLEQDNNCLLLWDFEPELDLDNPARATKSLSAAEKVIAVTSFASDSIKAMADIILPLAPVAESEGSLLNFDGDHTQFTPAGKLTGEARPGWKILRRLGHALGLDGFDQIDLGQLQAEVNEWVGQAELKATLTELQVPEYEDGLYRIGELPMYSIDALCRRSDALQQTVQAQNDFLGLNPVDADKIGLVDGALARVRQGENEAKLEVIVSSKVPAGGVWVRCATSQVCELGQAIGPVVVEIA